MVDRDECVEIKDVELVGTGPASIVVDTPTRRGVRIPSSQVQEDSEIHRDASVGERGTLIIPEWLADNERI